jgi:hypothetical protein
MAASLKRNSNVVDEAPTNKCYDLGSHFNQLTALLHLLMHVYIYVDFEEYHLLQHTNNR